MAARTGRRVTPLRPADPRALGGYRLLGRLGAGGMGVVYAAVDPAGRTVAVKLLHAVAAGDEEFRRRFRQEVSRARQVPPFCTAEVLDADLENDPPYLVVEYIDGPGLDEVVERDGPLNPANLHALAIGVATALTAIHGAGVVHRDLKPGNVLLAPGSPKVIDFGIARTGPQQLTNSGHLADPDRLTGPDHLVGTIAYMAPERFDTAPVTAAADIFSWGVVIAYAGTGRTPFQADSASGTAGRILTQRPDLAGLPEPLRSLVEKTLAKDPARRPDARELLDLLLAADPPPATTPAARTVPTHRTFPTRRASSRRRGGVVAAALLLGGIAAAVGVQATGKGSPTTPAVSPAPPAPVPVEPTGGTPLISDPLSRNGQWVYTNIAAEHATCDITDRLRATRAGRGVLLCTGPEMHIAGEHSIGVDTTLESPGSCAAIWFYWTGEHGGYVLRICSDAMTLAADRSLDRRVLGGLALTEPIELGRAVHVRIVALDDRAVIFRDHRYVGSLPLPAVDPRDGGDALGLSVDSVADRSPFSVTYANVDIRTYHD
ncbi:serine/threonine-protein kinase [Micromonosporaceae bacterium Da 78-11]